MGGGFLWKEVRKYLFLLGSYYQVAGKMIPHHKTLKCEESELFGKRENKIKKMINMHNNIGKMERFKCNVKSVIIASISNNMPFTDPFKSFNTQHKYIYIIKYVFIIFNNKIPFIKSWKESLIRKFFSIFIIFQMFIIQKKIIHSQIGYHPFFQEVKNKN